MRTIGQKEEIRRIRYTANVIAMVELGGLLLNFLLYPVMDRMPHYPEGSFGAQLTDLILYLIVFAIPVCVASKWSGMSAKELIGRGKPTKTIYIMTIGLTMGWSYIAGYFSIGIDGILQQFGLCEVADPYILPTSGGAMFLQFLAVAIVPPIVEELCYRGFFLNAAVRTMGTWSAIVLTSLAFWLAHYSIEILPLAFGFGMIGGYIRRRYGSLLPSMCAHFVVNSIYLITNIAWSIGGDFAGMMLSAGISLLEILLGAIGVTLFIQEGCLKQIREQSFGWRVSLTPAQITYAVLTSIPMLFTLGTIIYFTATNLEVL